MPCLVTDKTPKQGMSAASNLDGSRKKGLSIKYPFTYIVPEKWFLRLEELDHACQVGGGSHSGSSSASGRTGCGRIHGVVVVLAVWLHQAHAVEDANLVEGVHNTLEL